MAYDERLAERIRRVLAKHRAVTEKKMFGGIAFMLRGHMCCGILKDNLVVRVGPERYQEALVRPHARPMEFFPHHPKKGFVFVGPGGYRTEKTLADWVRRGVQFTLGLPAKRGGASS